MNKQVDNILNQVTELSKKYLNISERMLYEVSGISKKYDKIAKITGENYNIFRILNVSTAEVRTHSAFIADLLNPAGCHDMGNQFLTLFFNHIKNVVGQETDKDLQKKYLQIIDGFDCSNAFVEVEYPYNFTYERGRLDILIKDNKGKAIIIENKIYAGDQEEQMLRYYQYGKLDYQNNFLLLYLTLDGSDPSDWSTGLSKQKDNSDSIEEEENLKYYSISYKEFIFEWLKECKQKAVNHTLLRETLTQYINLIKYLTNQTINSNMEKEIKEIIAKDKDSLKAAFQISKTVPEFKNELIDKFNDKLKEIAGSLNLNVDGRLTGVKGAEKIWFYKKKWKSKMCLCFANKNFDWFWVGIRKNTTNKEEYNKDEYDHKENIFNTLKTEFPSSQNEKYYAWTRDFNDTWCPGNWSNNEEVWLNIHNENESFYEKMKELLKKLSDLLDEV